MKDLIEKIQKEEWQKDWEGAFSILSTSIAQDEHFLELMQELAGGSLWSIFATHKQGVTGAWFPIKDYEAFGTHLARRFSGVDGAEELAKLFKDAADEVRSCIKQDPEAFFQSVEASLHTFRTYTVYQNSTKILSNFLPADADPRIPHILEEARKYSETFFQDNETYMLELARFIGLRTGYTPELLLVASISELRTGYEGNPLPSIEDLKARQEGCGFIITHGQSYFISEVEVRSIEDTWFSGASGDSVQGKSAFSGKVTGRCRVILNFKGADIEEGDILVTGMTDPNFVPLMKKAGAIVTDGGGMLSHAAIVSRELKVPCIVGTKLATKMFRDGDVVEVDAERGVARKI